MTELMPGRALFSSLTLGRKLYAGFGAVLAVVAVLGVVVLLLMGAMDKRSRYLSGNSLPAIRAIDDMTASANRYVRHQREHMATSDPADKADVAGEIRNDDAQFRAADKALTALTTTPAERAGLARAEKLATEYQRETKTFLAFSNMGANESASQVLADADETFSSLEDTLANLGQARAADAHAATAAEQSSYTRAKTLVLALFALALVLGIAISAFVTRGVKRSVAPILDRLQSLVAHCTRDLLDGLERMAKGDLTFEATSVTPTIEKLGGDELGQIGRAVNDITERTGASLRAYNDTRSALGELIGKVQGASTTVADASQQIAANSVEAGRAIDDIALAVGEVASGAERQVAMVGQARESAEQTGAQAGDARRAAHDGVAAAQQASRAMEAVRESTSSVTEAIRELASRSEQIGGIVDTITGIASQTNLLALNAAIEAARAGEQGRGFAVVADEVRKLAEESQKAASTIAGLIEEIQADTTRTVEMVEDGVTRTEDGVAVVEQVRAAFEQIGAQVEEVTRQVEEIAQATSEVASVAQQSSASSERVSAATEQTSASAQEIAASAQELASTARRLEELATAFRLAD
jgi:methyl-accepting chemotaxis protein